MNNNEKILVVAGDSWTYGSEIRDPKLANSVFDWDIRNDHYRIQRIWPTKLSEMFGFDRVVNLSFPAASNDRIVRHLMGWLVQEYISKNLSTENLKVIVGFTSPERKDFYYKDEKDKFWITLWPMWRHEHPTKPLNEFSELYTTYFYNQEESTHRYLNQLFYLQSVFNLYKINFLFFQAFYQFKDMMIYNWVDNPYARHYNGQPDQILWNMIDPVRFIHKNDKVHSFHNYITSKDTDPEKRNAIQGMHPSELGHTWWAEHLKDYILENKLW